MNVILPSNLSDLWALLDTHPDSAVFAGGTDLFVKVRSRNITPPVAIGLERIGDLKGIRNEGSQIVIGACTTHTEMLSHSVVAGSLPILWKAIHVLGSPQVRNMATLGGNICTASPAGDCLPPLYVYDAVVEIASYRGLRQMKIRDFIIGPGKTALQAGEILIRVRINKPEGFAIHHFEKVGQRQAMSISIASLAAMVKTNSSGHIMNIALAWGSVAPRVVRAEKIEAGLIGVRLCKEDLKRVFPLILKSIAPISDVRASAQYRQQLAANLILRLTTHCDNS
jgi:CO/xanthine dehydrogenase FAD-binding subunit